MIVLADRKPILRRVTPLVLAAITLSAPAMAQTHPLATPTSTSEASDPITLHVAEAARRFGIPAPWIWVVMHVESAGEVRAVSRAGALGLMQIMPATWDYLRARCRLGADPFDAHDNVIAGTAFLREMYDRFGSPGFLGAYNAGPARYQDYLVTGRALPAETQRYLTILAPKLGGLQPLRGNFAPFDPLAWTRAPLFSVHLDRGSTAEPTASDGQRDLSPIDRSAVRNSAPDPRSSRLFVPLTGQKPS